MKKNSRFLMWSLLFLWGLYVFTTYMAEAAKR